MKTHFKASFSGVKGDKLEGQTRMAPQRRDSETSVYGLVEDGSVKTKAVIKPSSNFSKPSFSGKGSENIFSDPDEVLGQYKTNKASAIMGTYVY